MWYNTGRSEEVMKTVVLYHASCTDGAGSMWSAHKALGGTAKYLAIGHESKKQDSTLKKCKTADRVFMCDMMLEIETMREILDSGTEIRILDHHITNVDKLKASGLLTEYPGLLHDFTDMKRSGSGITWDYFHHEPRPSIINYVEDFDLWNWALPEGASIHTYLSQFTWKNNQYIIDTFNELAELSPGHLAARGKPLLDFKNNLIELSIKQVGRGVININDEESYNIPILNSNQFVSETGNIMAKNEPFAMIWQVSKTGEVRISLRSTQGIGVDVGRIAGLLGEGGGGHVHAAGTRFNSIYEMLEVIEFVNG